MNVRLAAVKALEQVIVKGRSLDTALPEQLEQVGLQDRPLLQELCYGVLRWRWRLLAVLTPLLAKPLRERDTDVAILLLVGLYQLTYLDIPEHATVSETVNAAGLMGKAKVWSKGLINAVMRGYLRQKEPLLAKADSDDVAALSHPAWLLQSFAQDWPLHWRAIAMANNQRAPMTLRVNVRKISPAGYLDLLAAAGIRAHLAAYTDAGITLQAPIDVMRLPGFNDGLVSVQDAAGQLVAPLLNLAPGQRILDACAAPGGKTSHMLEMQPGLLDVVAIDKNPLRLQRVESNLSRLGLSATLQAADVADTQSWFSGAPFDRILLDVPCSATGVIRRHPDIKSLRRSDDIPALALEQARLLSALWPLLRRGGMLMYSTCSVLKPENVAQMLQFLASHADAREVPVEAPWGHALQVGRQILPGEDQMDGFYFARIEKWG